MRRRLTNLSESVLLAVSDPSRLSISVGPALGSLFIACRRHRLLPEGGDPDPLAGTGVEARLGRHLTAARRAGQLRLDLAARVEWCDAYAALSEASSLPLTCVPAWPCGTTRPAR